VTWRWCFYINLPVGGLSAFILLFFFHTPKAAKPAPATLKEKFLQMDPVGSVLVMGAIISYILAFQYGGQRRPWNDSVVIGLIVGFVVISVTFVAWEFANSHNDRAMVPPRLLRDRQIWSISLFTFFNAGTYFLSIYLLPVYFQSISGVSPIQSGVRNLPMIIALMIGTSLSGAVIGKTGIATLWLPFGAAVATIAAGLLYTLDTETKAGGWIGYQVLTGLGWGMSFQIPITIAQGTVPPSYDHRHVTL
jgi:predicted MFS family arabinose efflux permease